MQETRKTFWVGLFMLCGLGALAALIVMFGQGGYWSRGAAYVINVKLPHAAGVRLGTVATVAGLPVGRVVSVDFADPQRPGQGVVAVIAFDDPVRALHEGAAATTPEPGLGMGRPPIYIYPGDPDKPVLASGTTIKGRVTSTVESIIPKEIVDNVTTTAESIRQAADALTPVLRDLHEVLQPRDVSEVDRPGGPPGNLASAMARLDSALKHFNDVLGDPQTKSHLRASIENFHAISEDGKAAVADLKAAAGTVRTAAEDARELIAQGRQTAARIDEQVQTVSQKVVHTLDAASGLLTRLDQTVAHVQSGQGTLGRLLYDGKLYDAMVLAFRRLSETAREFKILVQEWQKGEIRVAF